MNVCFLASCHLLKQIKQIYILTDYYRNIFSDQTADDNFSLFFLNTGGR